MNPICSCSTPIIGNTPIFMPAKQRQKDKDDRRGRAHDLRANQMIHTADQRSIFRSKRLIVNLSLPYAPLLSVSLLLYS